jgi:hypothetical protein
LVAGEELASQEERLYVGLHVCFAAAHGGGGQACCHLVEGLSLRLNPKDPIKQLF